MTNGRRLIMCYKDKSLRLQQQLRGFENIFSQSNFKDILIRTQLFFAICKMKDAAYKNRLNEMIIRNLLREIRDLRGQL